MKKKIAKGLFSLSNTPLGDLMVGLKLHFHLVTKQVKVDKV